MEIAPPLWYDDPAKFVLGFRRWLAELVHPDRAAGRGSRAPRRPLRKQTHSARSPLQPIGNAPLTARAQKKLRREAKKKRQGGSQPVTAPKRKRESPSSDLRHRSADTQPAPAAAAAAAPASGGSAHAQKLAARLRQGERAAQEAKAALHDEEERVRKRRKLAAEQPLQLQM